MKAGHKIWLPLIALIADFGAVVAGTWLAYLLRFSSFITTRIPIITGLPPLDWYLRLSLVFGGFALLTMSLGGMYRFPRQEALFDELTSSAKYYLSAFTLLLASLFFYREVSFSRLTMLIIFILSGFCLALVRIFGRWLREKLYSLGVAIRRAAIVGEGEHAIPVLAHLKKHPEFGLHVVGSIGWSDKQVEGLQTIGRISHAGKTVREHGLDTLIITPAAEEREVLPKLVSACYGVNVDFLYLPEIHPANGRPRKIVDIGGVPLWTLKENPFQGWTGLLKRSFDLIFSIILFLISLPVMLVIAVLVKLDSAGSVLYFQKRIGLDGREFNCLKFRSMRVDAEDTTGPVWAKPGDKRVTRVGRVLRRWSLDELPQLWNVFRGDMSLVGPRPERPEFVKQFEKSIDGYQERHRVRAGMTGWAQVNGLRGDSPIEVRTQYDRYYVENWSLLFDIKIMLLTLLAVIKGENSY